MENNAAAAAGLDVMLAMECRLCCPVPEPREAAPALSQDVPEPTGAVPVAEPVPVAVSGSAALAPAPPLGLLKCERDYDVPILDPEEIERFYGNNVEQLIILAEPAAAAVPAAAASAAAEPAAEEAAVLPRLPFPDFIEIYRGVVAQDTSAPDAGKEAPTPADAAVAPVAVSEVAVVPPTATETVDDADLAPPVADEVKVSAPEPVAAAAVADFELETVPAATIASDCVAGVVPESGAVVTNAAEMPAPSSAVAGEGDGSGPSAEAAESPLEQGSEHATLQASMDSGDEPADVPRAQVTFTHGVVMVSSARASELFAGIRQAAALTPAPLEALFEQSLFAETARLAETGSPAWLDVFKDALELRGVAHWQICDQVSKVHGYVDRRLRAMRFVPVVAESELATLLRVFILLRRGDYIPKYFFFDDVADLVSRDAFTETCAVLFCRAAEVAGSPYARGIAECLRDFPESDAVAGAACAAVAKILTSNGDDAMKCLLQQIARQGVVTAMSGMLAKFSTRSTILSACEALLLVAQASEALGAFVFKARGGENLVQVLTLFIADREVVLLALKLLLALVASVADAPVGANKITVHAIRRHFACANVLKAGCDVLMRLSSKPISSAECGIAGVEGLRLVTDVLEKHADNDDLAFSAATTLVNVALHVNKGDSKEMTEEEWRLYEYMIEESVPALIRGMRLSMAPGASLGKAPHRFCWALGAIAHGSDSSIVAGGGIEALLDLLARFKSDKTLATYACMALKRLSGDELPCKAIVACGGFDVLLDVLRTHRIGDHLTYIAGVFDNMALVEKQR